MIFGTPIPEYHAPMDVTGPAAAESMSVLIQVLDAVYRDGKLELGELTPALGEMLRPWNEVLEYASPPGVICLALACWAQIHGLVSLELFGHLSIDPEPGAVEPFFEFEIQAMLARIKVQAASATFTDVMVRKGINTGLKETPPFPPGYDFVGVVDKLGPGANTLKVGQMAADLTVFGAYSEYIVRPAISLVPVPDGLDSAEAVSLVLSYVTAYPMLHRLGKVQRGDRILVHGGGGAVGSALLQLGQLLDLEIYATSSKSKHGLVTSLGGIPIDYKSEDFVERVLSVGGVDVVFDPIGGDYYKRSFQTLKKSGMLVAYGFYNNAMGRGGNVPLEYMSIVLWNILPNGCKSAFYSIGLLRKKRPDWFKEDLTELFYLLAEGKIKPDIEKRMKLDQAAKAHELIEQAAVKGRLVLEVGN